LKALLLAFKIQFFRVPVSLCCYEKKPHHRNTYLACLHDQNKSGFLEGRLLSSQSEQSEKFLKSPNWPALQKSHVCFHHGNRL